MTGRIFSGRGAIVLAVILLAVSTAALGRQLAVQSRSPLTLLADDYRTGGGAGVMRWAGRFGFPTLALQSPLWEVRAELPQPGNLAITAGNGSWQLFDDELTAEQWHEINRWVQAGNALLIVTSDTDSLPEPVRDHFTNEPVGDEETEPRFVNPDQSADETDEEDIVNIAAWWGGELAVAERGPRLVDAPEGWVLAGTPRSAVLVKRPLGDGQLYLMLDKHAWANAGFDQGDNAAALARVLQEELTPGGVLAIDHYRHGRGRVESFATFLLALPGAEAFCGMSLLIGLFWIWGRNQRLGPAEEYYTTQRRTAQEYIKAAAAMNQRARAAPLAVESVTERVNYLLHQRGHLSSAGRDLIERARRHVSRANRPASPTDEITLVNELIQLRRKLYGTRPDSRAD